MPNTVLITGANRGIGLAMTRIFAEKGYIVLAGCRNMDAAKELAALKEKHRTSLHPICLDVTSDRSVIKAAKEAAKYVDKLDLLMNNAGVLPKPHDAKLEDLEFNQCEEAFKINCLGPLRVTAAFLPLLRESKNPRVANTSSGAGSISGKDNGMFYAYGPSKAALNMISRTMAFEFKQENIIVIALDPGWVKTDMGGPNAHLEPMESATAIVATMEGLTMEKTGKFLHNGGKELSW
jgi:NAD(P)-dependent dehydrogenase (short-subunit alcohol dehydrogenase family)